MKLEACQFLIFTLHSSFFELPKPSPENSRKARSPTLPTSEVVQFYFFVSRDRRLCGWPGPPAAIPGDSLRLVPRLTKTANTSVFPTQQTARPPRREGEASRCHASGIGSSLEKLRRILPTDEPEKRRCLATIRFPSPRQIEILFKTEGPGFHASTFPSSATIRIPLLGKVIAPSQAPAHQVDSDGHGRTSFRTQVMVGR